MAEFDHLLRGTMFRRNKPVVEWVAVEDVFSRNAHMLTYFHGMAGILSALCYRSEIALGFVNPRSMKKAMAGDGRADKGAMVSAARARFPGVNISNHDEADAIAAGFWFLEEYYVDEATR